MKQHFSPDRIRLYVLLAILAIGIFFRFYNTPLRYSLGDDSSRDAMVALEDTKELQLPLLGPFSSLGPFTFGPWYYYQLIGFSLLTHNAYAPWMYLGLASVGFIFVMYQIGAMLINPYFGLVTAFFVAISPPQISTATGLTNPNLISFFAGLSFLLFFFLVKKNVSYWWSVLFGFVLGVGINLHYQMAGLLVLPLLLFVVKRKNIAFITGTFGGIFIAFLPVLFFNLTNHWYLFNNLWYFYTKGKNVFYVPNRWLFYLRDFWPLFWSNTLGLSKIWGLLFFLALPISFIAMIWQKKLTRMWFYFFAAFFIDFILLPYYWGERLLGYLQFLHPFLFIFTALILWQILSLRFGKLLLIIVLLGLGFIILPESMKQLQPDPFNPYVYKQTAIILSDFPHKKIAMYNCQRNYSFRTQAVSLLIAMQGRLDDKNGVKVGFMDNHCDYPKDNLYNPPDATPSAADLRKIFPQLVGIDAINLSIASESAIAAQGWEMLYPKVVSDATTRWWFHEQP